MRKALWKEALRAFVEEKKKVRRRTPRILLMEDYSGSVSNEIIKQANRLFGKEVFKRVGKSKAPKIKLITFG